ncbi:MAG: patatin-like phospholipase family protein [Symbiobacterium sp.]|uniref:patatin-like phospholipase family protein n=1 Tax=Symbiobacterium sp. TaxID=1971213 RepID=UPI0034647724
MQANPRVALILSSGAARGFAHVGVLEVLDAAGIRPSLIVGASFGGLVGAAYAAGRAPAEMAALVRRIDFRTVLALTDPTRPRDGLVAGDRLEAFFADLVAHADFAGLKTPAVLIATDLDTGCPVVLNRGDVARAIRASTAIPGIFAPVRWEGRELVDGSLSSGLPVWAVGDPKSWVIVAVDVTSSVDAGPFAAALRTVGHLPWLLPEGGRDVLPAKPDHMPAIAWSVLRAARFVGRATDTLQEQTRGKLVLIRPPVQNVRWFEFTRGDEIRRLGFQAAMQALPRIERALQAG